eukprot:352044-Chlamydomonas_euryale.AAC.2
MPPLSPPTRLDTATCCSPYAQTPSPQQRQRAAVPGSRRSRKAWRKEVFGRPATAKTKAHPDEVADAVQVSVEAAKCAAFWQMMSQTPLLSLPPVPPHGRAAGCQTWRHERLWRSYL